MAADPQQCEDAGAALYDALRLFEGCSTGSDPNYRATFIDTYGVLAVHVAAADGDALTAEQSQALRQIFYLDAANIAGWPGKVEPATADSTLDRLCDWVTAIGRFEAQQGRTRKSPLLVAGDQVFSVMLTVAS